MPFSVYLGNCWFLYCFFPHYHVELSKILFYLRHNWGYSVMCRFLNLLEDTKRELGWPLRKNEIGFLHWMYDHYEEETKDACINIENTNWKSLGVDSKAFLIQLLSSLGREDPFLKEWIGHRPLSREGMNRPSKGDVFAWQERTFVYNDDNVKWKNVVCCDGNFFQPCNKSISLKENIKKTAPD